MNLKKIKFCLGLNIEHFREGIFLHKKCTLKKILKPFYMDKTHPLTSSMIVRLRDVKKDHFHPPEESEEFLDPDISYPSANDALTYLATVHDQTLHFQSTY